MYLHRHTSINIYLHIISAVDLRHLVIFQQYIIQLQIHKSIFYLAELQNIFYICFILSTSLPNAFLIVFNNRLNCKELKKSHFMEVSSTRPHAKNMRRKKEGRPIIYRCRIQCIKTTSLLPDNKNWTKLLWVGSY